MAQRLQNKNAGAGGVEVAREVRGAEVAREVREAEETRKILEADAAAGGSSTKAFDPCLDTGEVGEGPAVEEVGEPVIESQPEQLKKFEK